MKQDFLKYTLNIQLFANPGNDGGDGGDGTNPTVVDTNPSQLNFDYDKLAEAIAKRNASHETAVLKGMLKEQGLTKEEVDEAVKQYKQNQANKAKEEQKRIDDILAENKRYKEAEIAKQVNDEASKIAKEIGVRDDRIETLITLCDRSKFTDDKGVVNKEEMKKELEAKLTSVPEFKNKKQVTIQSVKTNAQTPHEMTDEEEYRKRKYGKNKYFRG
ncbi:hypothetical protein [Longibaculum muris]|uniref:hypothetical protein n=1 Tax=Longibaculum muris TaxID=1796628 RepID=UPI0029436EBF|nr:hypothetical protein [Longibaculum muris]